MTPLNSELSSSCIVGASRGLGREVARALAKKVDTRSLLLVARDQTSLEKLKEELISTKPGLLVEIVVLDASKSEFVPALGAVLQRLHIQEVIYCAGGGSHGGYDTHSWQSHFWTLKVNFLSPAELLHWSLSQNELIKRIVFVGSAIAEKLPEPRGPSYAAAKSGLLGLVRSVQADPGVSTEVCLFSPGYLDTELLPKGSWPRRLANLLVPPERAARQLVASLYGS